MRCIIIEDQPPAQRILKKYIEDAGGLSLTGIFPSALEAMEFMREEEVELIFLDIHLPKLSGLDFLKSLSRPPAVILTTAFPDYALESWELDVVDYLLKPFSFQRFLKAINKIPDPESGKQPVDGTRASPARRKEIFIKSGYEHIRVKIDDISFIKSDADYTEIHVKGRKLLSNEALSSWLETLDTEQFSRVHKSYIVNGIHIEKVTGNQIYLYDGGIIPIGRAYKEAFMERFIQ